MCFLGAVSLCSHTLNNVWLGLATKSTNYSRGCTGNRDCLQSEVLSFCFVSTMLIVSFVNPSSITLLTGQSLPSFHYIYGKEMATVTFSNNSDKYLYDPSCLSGCTW